MYLNSEYHMHNLSKAREASVASKVECDICGNEYTKAGITNHRIKCAKLKKKCPVCETEHDKVGVTCSYSCANTHFRTGPDHGNWKEHQYRTTCFAYHVKKCVVCSEDKIVEVHHLDENNKNNDPSNLIPMCPTHHQYWHSRYKSEVEDIVRSYIRDWESMVNLPPLEGGDASSNLASLTN